ncbi:hypothetical protein EVAR_23553_1 [Eumeta japonica]|uniref:Uncharacterized protein n=1 Tax=Eumeta variegata TaxID=151549 RepID=A0A4C1WXW8_EUMVA|nr:hypothetical protein EVAR_23553_1 [Eumeta japonica]
MCALFTSVSKQKERKSGIYLYENNWKEDITSGRCYDAQTPGARGKGSRFWATKKESRFLNHERKSGAPRRIKRIWARPRLNQDGRAAKLRSIVQSIEKVMDGVCQERNTILIHS